MSARPPKARFALRRTLRLNQCFVCHPEKQADFAAQYEAKYGTKPPPTAYGEREARVTTRPLV